MNEAVARVQTYSRMVWRYRWVALVCATVLCIGGWVTVLQLPNQYEVTAKVFLDTRSMLRPLLKGLALDSNTRQDAVLMVRRTLLVRPNLETVARKTDMDLKIENPADFELLLDRLAKQIKVSGTTTDDIFVITYKNRDPKLATHVVEVLLNIFVERSLGASREDTNKTKEFLGRQIKEYERRLEAGELRLKQFKQKNVGMMPADGATYFSRLQTAAGVLREARLQLREAENRRDALQRQLAGEEPSFGLGPAGPNSSEEVSPLDTRIGNLESKLDELLLQYTERHPDVMAMRDIIEQLERQKEAERRKNALQAPGSHGRFNENLVYQNLQISLSASEAEVAALQARVAEYERRETELKQLVDTIPKVEAELARLNRDYAINKNNYEELVKRREALSLSDAVDKTTDDVQFNILEPPREPLVPNSPNRLVLNMVVLVIGVGAGIGAAWLLAMVRPAIYTKEGFGEFTDLPVLGSVSRILTPKEVVRRRLEIAAFAVGCVCLLGLFTGLVSLETLNVDMAAKLLDMGAHSDVLSKLPGLGD